MSDLDTWNMHVTKQVEEPPSFFDPIAVRKRYLVGLTEIDQATTGVTFAADAEYWDKYGWAPARGSNHRNSIREVMASVAIYCRFPNTQDVRASVYASYKENGARVGKKGYELPDAEAWAGEPQPLVGEGLRATKTCPFCAEDILVEAIKCKHCGEFLSKTNSAEQIPSADVVLAQAIVSSSSSADVLLGEVIDNPANPNQAIGAEGRLGITWSPSRSVFLVRIEKDGGAGAFELSRTELILLVAEYQKAKKIAQTLPAGKPVTTWECKREDISHISTVAAQVPDVGLQVVFIGIRESDKSLSSFAAPIWWPTDARLALHYAEVNTYFESLLALALNVANAKVAAPHP